MSIMLIGTVMWLACWLDQILAHHLDTEALLPDWLFPLGVFSIVIGGILFDWLHSNGE